MKSLARFFGIISVCSLSISAFADMDPSSALLLKNGAGNSGVNLDSGRYTIRQETPTNVQKTPEKQPALKTVTGPAPAAATPAPAPTPTSAPAATPASTNQEDFSERMKDFFMGGDVEDILRYRSALHPEDSRQNFVEVSVAPGIVYIDSKSDYWYRKFHSTGPGLGVGAKFWITPFFGIQSTYFTSFAADMSAEYDSGRRVNVDHRIFNAGLQFRKFFNMSRKSPGISFGINYDENQLLVPKTEVQRARFKNTGVSLRLEASIPDTNVKSWNYGVDFMPKVKVTEQKTALDLRTGNKPTSYGFKFGFGQDFNFDRNHRIFWRLSHRLDKTVYEGAANQPDPITGNTPTGVSVTQGTSLFQFGFTWGD